MPKKGHEAISDILKSARIDAGYANREIPNAPISPKMIGKHERGEAEPTPNDMVVYSSAYCNPGLMFHYCNECPIGRRLNKQVEDYELTHSVLRLSNRVRAIREGLTCIQKIVDDGQVTPDEKPDLIRFIRETDELTAASSSLKMILFNLGIITFEELNEPEKVEERSSYAKLAIQRA